MYTINFPAIAPSAAHNFSVKTIEFKMAAVSVKRSIRYFFQLHSSNAQRSKISSTYNSSGVEVSSPDEIEQANVDFYRPFYRYGGHPEFRGNYGMPRGQMRNN